MLMAPMDSPRIRLKKKENSNFTKSGKGQRTSQEDPIPVHVVGKSPPKKSTPTFTLEKCIEAYERLKENIIVEEMPQKMPAMKA